MPPPCHAAWGACPTLEHPDVPDHQPQLHPTPASEIELLQSCHKGAWARGEETVRVARTSPRKGFELQNKDLEPRSAFRED